MRWVLLVLALAFAAPAGAAWFTGNGAREALSVLRDKPAGSLSETEAALLTAANRTGWIDIPACGWGSNAVLVNVGGVDYAITSLHLLVAKLPGDVHCEPDDPALFYPYAAYRGPGDPALPELARVTVELEPMPVNFTRSGVAMPWVEDWVAYRLTRPVSDGIMPEGTWGAGQPRGAMQWSSRQYTSGPVWVLGYDGRFHRENGWQFSWQECEQRRQRFGMAVIYFSCDISPGASSSPIMVMEDGEMTLQGIVSASMEPWIGTDTALPESALFWNLGTASEGMQRRLERLAAP